MTIWNWAHSHSVDIQSHHTAPSGGRLVQLDVKRQRDSSRVDHSVRFNSLTPAEPQFPGINSSPSSSRIFIYPILSWRPLSTGIIPSNFRIYRNEGQCRFSSAPWFEKSAVLDGTIIPRYAYNYFIPGVIHWIGM